MKKLLFLFFVLAGMNSFAQQEASVVTVIGEGKAEIVPDEVLIKARVEHEGESAQAVKEKNEAVIDNILKFLKSEGIPSENVQTEYLRLDKQYNYETKDYFFSANQALSIKLDELEKYEEIMSGLMESGLNRIDGIEFGTSKKEELESEARKEAMLDAQQKARELASAIGQKIGNAHRINEIEEGNFQPVYRVAEMKMADSSAQQTIAPGELEISVKVNVSFHLYPKEQ